jgi:hypothetical protein
MNYKMMDMHLKKADPTYLFKQMEVIDNNIIEYQKMKNDLIKARGSGGSKQALRIAEARAKDAVFNAKAKQDANKPTKITSKQENLQRLNEGLNQKVIIGAIQSAIKEDDVYTSLKNENKLTNESVQNLVSDALVNKIFGKVASENKVKDSADKQVGILLSDQISKAIDSMSTGDKDVIFSAQGGGNDGVTKLLEGIQSNLAVRSDVADSAQLHTKAQGIKEALATLATQQQVTTKPKDIDTAQFFQGLGGPSYAGRIKELNKLIEGERQRKAQLGTQADLQIKQLQEMSPFEPFQRNYVRETAFQSRPSQQARQDLISQQLAKSVEGTSSYPGLEFNKPYETAGGMMVGVTQVGGEQKPFSIIGGREDIYSPGETGYNEIDRLLKQLSMVQKEQSQMVK